MDFKIKDVKGHVVDHSRLVFLNVVQKDSDGNVIQRQEVVLENGKVCHVSGWSDFFPVKVMDRGEAFSPSFPPLLGILTQHQSLDLKFSNRGSVQVNGYFADSKGQMNGSSLSFYVAEDKLFERNIHRPGISCFAFVSWRDFVFQRRVFVCHTHTYSNLCILTV